MDLETKKNKYKRNRKNCKLCYHPSDRQEGHREKEKDRRGEKA